MLKAFCFPQTYTRQNARKWRCRSPPNRPESLKSKVRHIRSDYNLRPFPKVFFESPIPFKKEKHQKTYAALVSFLIFKRQILPLHHNNISSWVFHAHNSAPITVLPLKSSYQQHSTWHPTKITTQMLTEFSKMMHPTCRLVQHPPRRWRLHS